MVMSAANYKIFKLWKL